MKRTYKIETGKYHTTIVLWFSTDFSEARFFREVFLLDPKASMTVAVSGVQPFVVVVFNNPSEESLATLIEMIEAAGFEKEATDV